MTGVPARRSSMVSSTVAQLLEPFAQQRTDEQLRRRSSGDTPAVSLRRLEIGDPLTGDVHAVLCAAEVAERFRTPAELTTWLGGSLRAVWVAHTGDGEVCAAAAAHHLDAAEVAELNARWPGRFAAGDGYLFAGASAPRWRRRGLHTRLVAARLEWFTGLGTATVHTVAWRHAAGESHPTLVRAGFVEVASVGRCGDGYDDTATLMRFAR